jgi:hypothetical protein
VTGIANVAPLEAALLDVDRHHRAEGQILQGVRERDVDV